MLCLDSSLPLTASFSNSNPALRLTTPNTALLSIFLPLASPHAFASPAASRYISPSLRSIPFSFARLTACPTSLIPNSSPDRGASLGAGQYAPLISRSDTPAAYVPKLCSTSVCSVEEGRPDTSASVCASESKYMSPAVMELLVVFKSSAFSGCSPTSITARAMTPCKYGFTIAIADADPATATSSCPACATGVEPKTGAAMYVAECEERRDEMVADVFG